MRDFFVIRGPLGKENNQQEHGHNNSNDLKQSQRGARATKHHTANTIRITMAAFAPPRSCPLKSHPVQEQPKQELQEQALYA
jgi:hypothetical protein